MPGGPQPLDHSSRLALAVQIAREILASKGQKVMAIGAYGSLARGTDGPCSDVEILCILSTSGEDYRIKWSSGPWKAEVDFLSEDLAWQQASRIDGDWALTHGAWQYFFPLHDPQGFLPKLSAPIQSPPPEFLQSALREIIVDDLYELIGKLRNAWHFQNIGYLLTLAIQITQAGCLLVGLANQHLYSNASTMLSEATNLPDRPVGFDKLCQLTQTGQLTDPRMIYMTCEEFWAGVESWITLNGLEIESQELIPI